MEQLSQQILRMEKTHDQNSCKAESTESGDRQSGYHHQVNQATIIIEPSHHHFGIRPLLLYSNQAITILESDHCLIGIRPLSYWNQAPFDWNQATIAWESGRSHMEKLGHHCNLTLDQNQPTIIELNQVTLHWKSIIPLSQWNYIGSQLRLTSLGACTHSTSVF